MPRAHRYYVPGQVWHITHRCHKQSFLLKFRKDRQTWTDWLYEAKKRFGLSVLNYTVTSNHVHLLARDTAPGIIARSLQLIAGRTAQAYNQRKQRRGAFWEDRYHATAVDTDAHLWRCLVYIDLNMVRAGVVAHPRDWPHGGYHEIQAPKQRYRILDLDALRMYSGVADLERLASRHRHWIDAALATGAERQPVWTESLAVGNASFVRHIQRNLGIDARYRDLAVTGETCILKEAPGAYTGHLGHEMRRLRR